MNYNILSCTYNYIDDCNINHLTKPNTTACINRNCNFRK